MRTPSAPSAQLDLFGEIAAAEARAQARREWNANPQTCPHCGRTEPTGFLLSNNHVLGYGPDDWRLYTDHCSAMYLSRNHVLYDADPSNDRQADLPRTVARAREVWANRLDDLRASLAEHDIDLDELP